MRKNPRVPNEFSKELWSVNYHDHESGKTGIIIFMQKNKLEMF